MLIEWTEVDIRYERLNGKFIFHLGEMKRGGYISGELENWATAISNNEFQISKLIWVQASYKKKENKKQ